MTAMAPSPSYLSASSRPQPKRLLSLQARPAPYSSPLLSPTSSSSGGAGGPRRPGAPKRSHSFCADSDRSTYALASTSAAHLTADRRALVAPPLERTLSSIGSKGNMSPTSLQMGRPPWVTHTPCPTPMVEESVLAESSRQNLPSSPPRVPTILISASTPPKARPALTTRPPLSPSLPSSRSSSYELSPSTPGVSAIFGREPLGGADLLEQKDMKDVEDERMEAVAEAVTELAVVA